MTKNKPTKRIERVKAFAIVCNEKIETADYFVDHSCPAQDESNAMAIYEKRKDARLMISGGSDEHKIVPVTLSYELLLTKPKK